MSSEEDGLKFTNFDLTDDQDDNQKNETRKDYNPISEITNLASFGFEFEPDEDIDDDLYVNNGLNKPDDKETKQEVGESKEVDHESESNELYDIDYDQDEDILLLPDDNIIEDEIYINANNEEVVNNDELTTANTQQHEVNDKDDYYSDFAALKDEDNFETLLDIQDSKVEIYNEEELDKPNAEITNTEKDNYPTENYNNVFEELDNSEHESEIREDITENEAEDILAQVMAQDFTTPIEGFEKYAELKKIREEASKALDGAGYTDLNIQVDEEDQIIEESSEAAGDKELNTFAFEDIDEDDEDEELVLDNDSDIYKEIDSDQLDLVIDKEDFEIGQEDSLEDLDLSELEYNLENENIESYNNNDQETDLNNIKPELGDLDISDITNLETNDIDEDEDTFDLLLNDEVSEDESEFDLSDHDNNDDEESEFDLSDLNSSDDEESEFDLSDLDNSDDEESEFDLSDFNNSDDEESEFDLSDLDSSDDEESEFDLSDLDSSDDKDNEFSINDLKVGEEDIDMDDADEFSFDSLNMFEEEEDSDDNDFAIDFGEEESDDESNEDDFDFDMEGEDSDEFDFDDVDLGFDSTIDDDLGLDLDDDDFGDDVLSDYEKEELTTKTQEYLIKLRKVIKNLPKTKDEFVQNTKDFLAKIKEIKKEVKEEGFKPTSKKYCNLALDSMKGSINKVNSKIQDKLKPKPVKANVQSKTKSKPEQEKSGVILDEWDGGDGGDTWGLGPIAEEEASNSNESADIESDEEGSEADWDDDDFSLSTADMLMEDSELGLEEFGDFGGSGGDTETEEKEDTTDYTGVLGRFRKIKKVTYKWARLLYKYFDTIIDFEKNWWKVIDFFAVVILMTSFAMVIAYYLWHK